MADHTGLGISREQASQRVVPATTARSPSLKNDDVFSVSDYPPLSLSDYPAQMCGMSGASMAEKQPAE